MVYVKNSAFPNIFFYNLYYFYQIKAPVFQPMLVLLHVSVNRCLLNAARALIGSRLRSLSMWLCYGPFQLSVFHRPRRGAGGVRRKRSWPTAELALNRALESCCCVRFLAEKSPLLIMSDTIFGGIEG